MEHYKLPAYNKARELAMQLIKSTQKVPRDIRYTYIRDLQLMAMAIMEHIAFANEKAEERISFLEKALSDLHKITIRIRIMKDLNHISTKGYSVVIRKEEELTRQLVGWLNKTKETNNR